MWGRGKKGGRVYFSFIPVLLHLSKEGVRDTCFRVELTGFALRGGRTQPQQRQSIPRQATKLKGSAHDYTPP